MALLLVLAAVGMLLVAMAPMGTGATVTTASAAAIPSVTLSVNFSVPLYSHVTHTTLQVVHNPLLRRRFSPIHDQVFDALAKLRADYVRFAAWFPYPKLVVAELDSPSGTSLCGNVGVGYSVNLSCAASQPGQPDGVIAKIEYASFGAASGRCLSFTEGSCYSANSTDVVAKMCVGKRDCVVPASETLFGTPCPSDPSSQRLAVQVVCDPPQNHTYWNFTLLNEVLEDVLEATDSDIRIINLDTWPQWLFNLSGITPNYYPDDPNAVDWGYPQGNQLLDPTGEQIGAYFARLASYYTQGGMTDEYGVYHASPYQYDFQIWEVLNEFDFQFSVQTYTTIYDSVVRQIRACCDPDNKMQFVGLALANLNNDVFRYFLNSSNHAPDTPLDWVSFHHYGLPSTSTNVTEWQVIYQQADDFVTGVIEYDAIRQELSPTTRTTIDEVGVILPSDKPVWPTIYYNVVCSMYAYLYARVLPIGIDVLGSSQLVAFPELATLGLAPQSPSVAMLNWTTGAGSVRYWLLDMMLEHLAPGDAVVQLNVSVAGGASGPAADVTRPLMAVAFAPRSAEEVAAHEANVNERARAHEGASTARLRARLASVQSQRLLLVNTVETAVNVTLPASLVVQGAVVYTIDEATGESAAREESLLSATLQLAPFAVSIVVVPVSQQQQQSEQVVMMQKVVDA